MLVCQCNRPYHYHVNVESIQVGDEFLQLPAGVLDVRGDPNRGTILDTGSTLTYVPPVILKPLVEKVHTSILFLSVIFILSPI